MRRSVIDSLFLSAHGGLYTISSILISYFKGSKSESLLFLSELLVFSLFLDWVFASSDFSKEVSFVSQHRSALVGQLYEPQPQLV